MKSCSQYEAYLGLTTMAAKQQHISAAILPCAGICKQLRVVVITNVPPPTLTHHSGVEHKTLSLRDIPYDTLTLHYGAQFKGDMGCGKPAALCGFRSMQSCTIINVRSQNSVYHQQRCWQCVKYLDHKKTTKKVERETQK